MAAAAAQAEGDDAAREAGEGEAGGGAAETAAGGEGRGYAGALVLRGHTHYVLRWRIVK